MCGMRHAHVWVWDRHGWLGLARGWISLQWGNADAGLCQVRSGPAALQKTLHPAPLFCSPRAVTLAILSSGCSGAAALRIRDSRRLYF